MAGRVYRSTRITRPRETDRAGEYGCIASVEADDGAYLDAGPGSRGGGGGGDCGLDGHRLSPQGAGYGCQLSAGDLSSWPFGTIVLLCSVSPSGNTQEGKGGQGNPLWSASKLIN